MKKKVLSHLVAALFLTGVPLTAHDASMSTKPLKIGVVNFKKVVEESKLGKQEQANFEVLKKQMESVLEEKEKALNEISVKFNDQDYLDGLSTDGENELKHKFRTLNAELGQIQSQYYQTLNQANMKILQKLNEIVAQAASGVAKDAQIDLILNEESGFYYAPDLDFSKRVIATLDSLYDAEQKGGKK
ncbi:MAG: OmpH family outer membrane protein [Parachlamydiaceae bacterium]|nr:OmpH family outer membrane protein [Parachlamydiaceae bacterium]